MNNSRIDYYYKVGKTIRITQNNNDLFYSENTGAGFTPDFKFSTLTNMRETDLIALDLSEINAIESFLFGTGGISPDYTTLLNTIISYLTSIFLQLQNSNLYLNSIKANSDQNNTDNNTIISYLSQIFSDTSTLITNINSLIAQQSINFNSVISTLNNEIMQITAFANANNMNLSNVISSLTTLYNSIVSMNNDLNTFKTTNDNDLQTINTSIIALGNDLNSFAGTNDTDLQQIITNTAPLLVSPFPVV